MKMSLNHLKLTPMTLMVVSEVNQLIVWTGTIQGQMMKRGLARLKIKRRSITVVLLKTRWKGDTEKQRVRVFVQR